MHGRRLFTFSKCNRKIQVRRTRGICLNYRKWRIDRHMIELGETRSAATRIGLARSEVGATVFERLIYTCNDLGIVFLS